MKIQGKEQMQQGVKYKGYGFINEFNEFQFTPEQTGSRSQQKKLVKEEDGFTVYKTTKSVIIHIRVDRADGRNKLVGKFLEVTNRIMQVFTKYDI